ncbi:MAG TPA: RDD family protein [Flavisolibacter sp.]|nr:RDD family protein [Flavisolibacter sp.]
MNPNESYPSATESHLFEEGEFIEYDEASNGQRFLNYLIDNLFMRFVVSYGTSYLLLEFLVSTSPETAYEWFGSDGSWAAIYLIALLNHLVYYTICEKAFKGHTLGKLITGTRAIREDGEELTFKDALLRSLSRLVPFEALSIWFGNGLWHDTWTKTKVIKTR